MLKLKCNQDEVIVKAAVKGNKSDGFATITTFDNFHTLQDTVVSLTMLTRENTIAMRDYLTTLLEETIEPIQQEIGEPLSDWKKLKLSFVTRYHYSILIEQLKYWIGIRMIQVLIE